MNYIKNVIAGKLLCYKNNTTLWDMVLWQKAESGYLPIAKCFIPYFYTFLVSFM